MLGFFWEGEGGGGGWVARDRVIWRRRHKRVCLLLRDISNSCAV